MEKKPRSEHCVFKILNNNGKCVAPCHWLWDSDYKHDCIGICNPAIEPDEVDTVRGRSFKV